MSKMGAVWINIWVIHYREKKTVSQIETLEIKWIISVCNQRRRDPSQNSPAGWKQLNRESVSLNVDQIGSIQTEALRGKWMGKMNRENVQQLWDSN
jgi:hypothetical protein